MDTLLLNAPEHPLFSQSGEWITRIRIQIWSEVSWTIYICICIIYIHITVWEKNTTVWVTKATSMQGFATFHAVMKYIDIDLEIRLIHNDIIVNIIKVYYIIHVISKSCQSLYIYIRVCVCFLKVGCWSYLEVLGKSSSDWSIFGKTWHNWKSSEGETAAQRCTRGKWYMGVADNGIYCTVKWQCLRGKWGYMMVNPKNWGYPIFGRIHMFRYD